MEKFEMPTSAQIEKWKKAHGAVHKLTVKVPGQEDAICIVRDPLVSDISQSSTLGGGDEYKIGLIQLDNCWLAGDERIKTRLSFSQAAAKKMATIFPVFPWSIETCDVELLNMIPFLKDQGVSDEVIGILKTAGIVRKVTILNGNRPIMKDGTDMREEIVAYFSEPDLEVKEKVDLISDFLDQGNLFINECFLCGDQRFKDHSSEPIAFAAYMAGHKLIEEFTTEVEKL